jgi:hypothetical protein
MRIGKVVQLLIVLVVVLAYLVQPTEAKAGNSIPKTNGKMIYHGGPVLWTPPNIYFVFYGCWTCNLPGSNLDTITILADFASHLGNSPYSRINTTYWDANGSTPNGSVFYGGSVADFQYSVGSELSVENIQEIISRQISLGALPLDTAGIYVVLASSDVGSTATGFCEGPSSPYHANFLHNGTPVKYAFVGNPERCKPEAAPQFIATNGSVLPSPNGNLAADAMVSAIAHALNEVVTNPFGNGWFDKYGLESSDECYGRFGQIYTTPNGAAANMKLGTRDYLIQQNWVNTNLGYCALAYP